ncbi:MAG: hypothetical protein ACM3SY_02380 [Candidatus Omnitrophota bacterium]
MKRFGMWVLTAVVFLVLLFSPYLLVIDFERFSSFVVLIWIVSVAYFLMIKKKK